MKIAGLSAKLPSLVATNRDLLRYVERYSKEHFQGDFARLLTVIGRMLIKAKVHNRCWLALQEEPMELLRLAFAEAIAEAQLVPQDIDLLVFSSVARGFVVPSNAAMIVQSLGLSCRSFDVVDACMGWVSSVQVIDDMMKADSIQHAAVVNMEFNFFPEDDEALARIFRITHESELAYKFPRFTVGDAVSVTILKNEKKENFQFYFVNRPDAYDVCSIQLPGAKEFYQETPRQNVFYPPYEFISHGGCIKQISDREAIRVIQSAPFDWRAASAVIAHTLPDKNFDAWTEALGIKRLNSSSINTGNIASVSIPWGIHDAVINKIVQKRYMLGLEWRCWYGFFRGLV